MYDERDRLVGKKLPGAFRVEYVYNWAGRLIAQRDGNMATAGKWEAFHYDGLGRVREERLVTDSRSRVSMVSAYYDSEYPTEEVSGGALLRQYVYDSYPSGMASDLAYSAQNGVTTDGNADLRDNRTKGLLCYEKVNVLGTADYVERAYYYDRFARVIQRVEKRPEGRILRTSVKYDLQGNECAKAESFATSGGTICFLRTNNTYDSRGRLLTSTSTLDGTATMGAQYTYDDLGRLVKTTYGNGVTDSLSYDLRGWRTAQSVKKGNTDIFSSVLRYNTSGYGGLACWNGNIASQSWQYGQNAAQWHSGYRYDRAQRLTDATWDVDEYGRFVYGYDQNTNLTEFIAYDDYDELNDEVEYDLAGNRRSDYSYDANGNLTSTDDGWTVSYNLLNLPATATRGAGTDDEQTVEWSYLADGTKIGAWSWVPIDEVVEDEVVEESAEPELVLRSGGQGEPATDSLMMRSGYLYAGAFLLRWDEASAPTLESAAAVGGRFVQSGNNVQQRYFITDHLGSTRVVLNNSGSVVERYDYYPYGEKISVTVASSGNTDYLYTGKESQNELFGINWYDSAARFQTTDGIFTSLDPLAEKYYHLSPYAYCAGNPVRFGDYDGYDKKDKIIGYAVGIATNVVPFSTGLRGLYSPTDPIDYNGALMAVDAAALSIGETLTKGGATAAAVGVGAIAAGGTTIVVSGGTATVAGSAVAVAGAQTFAIGAKATFAGVMLMGNAGANKNAGYEYGKEASSGNGDYSNLPDPKNAGPGKKTTSTQRKLILEQNKNRNGGVIRSDQDGSILDPPSKMLKGQKANMNQAEIDHITARSKRGSNRNTNLQVLSKEQNLRKGNR